MELTYSADWLTPVFREREPVSRGDICRRVSEQTMRRRSEPEGCLLSEAGVSQRQEVLVSRVLTVQPTLLKNHSKEENVSSLLILLWEEMSEGQKKLLLLQGQPEVVGLFHF